MAHQKRGRDRSRNKSGPGNGSGLGHGAASGNGGSRGRGTSAALGGAGGSSASAATSASDVASASSYPLSLLRSARSDSLERSYLARALGFSFGTQRHVDTVLGYQQDLKYADYLQRYKRGGIAKRIVDFFPRMTWSTDAIVYEDEDPDLETAFESQSAELISRLRLWSTLVKADILASLGRYSVLLIGAAGDTNLETELPRMRGPQDVLYLTPLSETSATIDRLIDKKEQSSDPRFGLAELYKIKTGSAINTRLVHWSRIIHIAEGTLEDEVYGQPRLQAAWNLLDDLAKVVGGGAEATWTRADPGLHANYPLYAPDGKTRVEIDEDAAEEKFDDYKHKDRRYLLTQGVDKLNLLSSQVPLFGPNADSILQLIAGTYGFTSRVFLGSERGELASSQDRENVNDRKTERRADFALPIVRQLYDRLIQYGALVQPQQYDVDWRDGEEMSEDEKHEAAYKIAQANQAQNAAGGGVILSSDEIRERVYGLEPLEIEEEEDALEEEEEEDGVEIEDTARAAAYDLADILADEPEWKSLHRVADSHVEPLARMLLGIWRDAADAIDYNSLETVMTAVDANAVRQALEVEQDDARSNQLERALVQPLMVAGRALQYIDQQMSELMPDRLLSVVNDGGLAALRSARARGGFRAASGTVSGTVATNEMIDLPLRSARFSASFDVSNPRAITFAELRSSALVTEIASTTRAALRDLIAAAVRDGIAPRRLSQQIKQVVGLRLDQVQALQNYTDKLTAKGISEAGLERRAAKYARKLHSDRAILIARSETMRSANRGQVELWMQAQDKGQLPRDQKRTWIVTPDDRLRPEHEAMEGQERGIEEPFEPIAEPGSEPACRCGQGLV